MNGRFRKERDRSLSVLLSFDELDTNQALLGRGNPD